MIGFYFEKIFLKEELGKKVKNENGKLAWKHSHLLVGLVEEGTQFEQNLKKGWQQNRRIHGKGSKHESTQQ